MASTPKPNPNQSYRSIGNQWVRWAIAHPDFGRLEELLLGSGGSELHYYLPTQVQEAIYNPVYYCQTDICSILKPTNFSGIQPRHFQYNTKTKNEFNILMYTYISIYTYQASKGKQPTSASPGCSTGRKMQRSDIIYVNTMCKHPSALTFSRGSLLIFKQSEKGYARPGIQ